jgi:putative ABC transport system permease protein
MRFIFKLLTAGLIDRKSALLLIVVATAACSGLIAGVGGVYKLAGDRINQKVAKVIGPIDRIIISGTESDWEADKTRYGAVKADIGIEKEIVENIVNSPEIQRAYPAAYAKVEVLNPQQKYSGAMYRPGHTMVLPIMAMVDDLMPPASLVPGLSEEAWQTCVSQGTLVFPSVKGRDGKPRYSESAQVLVNSVDTANNAVIGTTYKAMDRVRNFGGMFVSRTLFETLTGQPFRINRIFVDLGENPDNQSVQRFDRAFELAALDAGLPVSMLKPQDYVDDMMENQMFRFSGFGLIPFSGTVLTVIGAFFIILHAVGIGNASRIKESIGLRAIGVPRNLLTILAILEALIPAIIGCIIGLIIARILYGMGLASDRMGMTFVTENFSGGVYNKALLAMMPYCFGITLASTLLAILPIARNIWKKHPLESDHVDADQEPTLTGRHALFRVIWAAVLFCINPLVTLWPGIPFSLRSILVPSTYITTLFAILLLVPLMTHLYRIVFSGPLSFMFNLRKELVNNFLRAHFAKVAAGTAAILIGLGLYVATLIWGYSMKTPFLLTEKAPDASVVVFPQGLNPPQIKEIATAKGIEQLVPLHMQHPTISDNQAQQRKGQLSDWRDLLYLGCDVYQVFGNDATKGIIDGRMIKGDEKNAFKQVMASNGCLISAELHRNDPDLFDIGKEIEIQKIGERQRIKHPIVGVIDVAGWHMFTKSARMRRGLGRLAGLVFVSENSLIHHYPDSKPRCFWLNVDPQQLNITDAPPGPPGRRIKPGKRPDPSRADRPMLKKRRPAPKATKPSVESVFKSAMTGLTGSGGDDFYVRVVNISEMTKAIERRSVNVINSIALVPFIALLLSSIAIAATIATSVQSRKRELGIFRSIGISRSGLFRLIFIESIVMVSVAALLGLIFGIVVAWSGIIISAGSWGVASPYIIPWKLVVPGCLIAVLAGLVGAVVPALIISAKETFALLNAEEAL